MARYTNGMSVISYEAVVEAGQIRLPAGVVLPDQTTVYIVVPRPAPAPKVAEELSDDDDSDTIPLALRQKQLRRLFEDNEW